MRDELQAHLNEIKDVFSGDFAALVTAQNIIDRNLAELVTFINELTTRTALAVEGPKVTNQLFNQGFSLIFNIFTQNINKNFNVLDNGQASSRASIKGKEKAEADEEAFKKEPSSKGCKEDSEQKSSHPKVFIGVNNISNITRLRS